MAAAVSTRWHKNNLPFTSEAVQRSSSTVAKGKTKNTTSNPQPAPRKKVQKEPINRSAGDKSKGFRLQKLRAALLLLRACENEKNIRVYAAIEADGDVLNVQVQGRGTEKHSEEDKNYAASGGFSFASEPVLNTMVIFVDLWLQEDCSPNYYLGFYSTTGISKEYKTGRIKNLGIELPSEAILRLLKERRYTEPNLLTAVKSLTLDEYKAAYQNRLKSSRYSQIKAWSDKQWIQFLSRIEWEMEQGDEKACEAQLNQAIRNSRYFKNGCAGLETYLAAKLLDLFDKYQSADSKSDRYVHGAEVETLFYEISSNRTRKADPCWKAWETEDPADRTRNIGDKVTDACPSISEARMKSVKRLAALGHSEIAEFDSDKTLHALRMRILSVCAEHLATVGPLGVTSSEYEIQQVFDQLVHVSIKRIQELKDDYDYVISNEGSVRHMVYTLFDECYLDFIKAP